MFNCPPILFVIFNRPDTTMRVFEKIRDARPERLYVAADGPRPGREEEKDRCDEARLIASAVDWPCQVYTLFREGNLGCREAVSSAITWFFEHEEAGIILEDDCLPHPTFFPYCAELLEHYRDNLEVMCISGDNSTGIDLPTSDSYLFSSFPLIWGWATWRRAWQKYDFEEFCNDKRLNVIKSINSTKEFVHFWKTTYLRVANLKINAWDYVWNYTVWKHNGLCCIPKKNLISNIGFGSDSTHTRNKNNPRAEYKIYAMSIPLSHPKTVTANKELDIKIPEAIHGIKKRPPFIKRIFRRVTKISFRPR